VALTKFESHAAVVPSAELTEEQLNEMLELMPLDQRDVLLMDDYLTLPHLKCVVSSFLALLLTACRSRPRIMVPLASSTEAVFMTQYSLIHDCLEDGSNSQRSARRFNVFSV
jgi:hypothetical protein